MYIPIKWCFPDKVSEKYLYVTCYYIADSMAQWFEHGLLFSLIKLE